MSHIQDNDGFLLRRIAEAIRERRGRSDWEIEAELDAMSAAPLTEPEIARIMNRVGALITESKADGTAGVSRARSAVPPARSVVDKSAAQQGEIDMTRRLMTIVASACVALTAGFLLTAFSRDKAERSLVVHSKTASPAVIERLAETETQREVADLVSQLDRQLAIGEAVSTGPRERQRVKLPDGSVLYLNENTTVSVAASRRVELGQGEVFVEVVPIQLAAGSREAFVVETPQRAITAVGTKFAVKANEQTTNVLVTQGQVRVNGVQEVLAAGQELTAAAPYQPRGVNELVPQAAPRASVAVDWARDLLADATAALVPASPHSGGSITVVDPSGQELKLALRKFHIDVHIEDGFARTTIDQTYFNHTYGRLEGTFRFPLPADASLSRLAMYVNGKLMEGGMVERDYGRNVFEQILHTKRDPALLEWVDGTTFQMRVFPLEPRQEKRILLSYTQRLPNDYGRTAYRFPSGHSLGHVRDWSSFVRIKNGAQGTWYSPSHVLASRPDGQDLVLEGSQKNALLDQDFVVEWQEQAQRHNAPRANSSAEQPNRSDGESSDTEDVRFTSVDQDGFRYLMLRFRPRLDTQRAERAPRNWVFLLERSADRDAVLARTQVEVLRTILQNAEHSDTFSVIRAATQAESFRRKPVECSATNIEAAVEYAARGPTLGALDLGQAIEACRRACRGRRESWIVHLGTGIPVLGERDEQTLLRRLPDNAKYVGVAVGKRWSQSFMNAAATRTGGHVTQINPDEQVGWRAFELVSTLNAPRLLEIRVTSDRQDVSFLTFNSMLADGQELAAVARLPLDARLPQTVTVRGRIAGRPFERALALSNVVPNAGYLPRTWARLEIDRLVGLGAEEHKQQLIELSKSMYVMCPFTSLLVLEDEAMYVQFNVDRGRKDHWAMYAAPAQVPVVADVQQGPHPGQPLDHLRRQVQEQTKRVQLADANRQRAAKDRRTADEMAKLDQLLNAARQDLQRLEMQLGWLEREQQDEVRRVLRTVVSWQPRLSAAVDNTDLYMLQVEDSLKLQSSIKGMINTNTVNRPSVLAQLLDDSRTGREAKDRWGARLAQLSGEIRTLDTSLWMNNRPFAGITLSPQDVSTVDLTTAPFQVTDGIDPFFGRDWSFPTSTSRGSGWRASAGVPGGFGAGGGSVHPTVTWAADDFFQWSLPESAGNVAESFRGDWQKRTFRRMVTEGREYDGLWLQPAQDFSNHFSDLAGTVASGGSLPSVGFRYYDFDTDGNAIIGNPWMDAGGGLPVLQGMPGNSGGWFYTAESHPNSPQTTVGDLTQQYGKYLSRSHLRGDTFGTRLGIPATNDGVEFRGGFGARGYLLPTIRRAESGLQFYYDPFGGEHQPAGFARFGLMPYVAHSVGVRPGVLRNLPSYAPGLQTWSADVLAVLEREAADRLNLKQGRIDIAARRLIDRARSRGWEEVIVGDTRATDRLSDSLTLRIDGAGRFQSERTTPDGLRESVVCDGKTLWHLYPEIGLGAKRDVSRFHNAALQTLVPWFVPSAEELAFGADVVAVADRIIRIIAIETADSPATHAPTYAVELVFDAHDRLVERRVVEVAANKTIARQTYSADGLVKTVDAAGNIIEEVHRERRACAEPNLVPDTNGLVVLPLPYRSAESVAVSVPVNLQTNAPDYAKLSRDDALRLLGTYFAEGRVSEFMTLQRERFYNLKENLVGLAVLQSALEPNESSVTGATTHYPDSSLARFLEQYAHWALYGDLNRDFGVDEAATPFLRQLAEAHNLFSLWSSGRATQDRTATQVAVEFDRAVAFLQKCRPHRVTWRLLEVIDQAVRPLAEFDKQRFRGLAEIAAEFESPDGDDQFARNHRIRWLLAAGDDEDSQQLFADSLTTRIQSGQLPVLDANVRTAFSERFHSSAMWAHIVRDAAALLASLDRQREAVVWAMQCAAMNERELAEELLESAVRGQDLSRNLPLLALAFHTAHRLQSWQRCEQYMAMMLADAGLARDPRLWRAAANLATQCGNEVLSLQRLEHALELEFALLPENVNLEAFRQQYAELFNRYDTAASRMADAKGRAVEELLSRAAMAAERWRSIDVDDTTVCHRIATLLTKLGRRNLAWDYWTSPLADAPRSSTAWATLARALTQHERAADANRAWETAFACEPTNPDLLWEHAQQLRQRGRFAESNRLLRQIADGQWQPRFSGTQQNARNALQTSP